MNEPELVAALRRICAVDVRAVARVRDRLPQLAAQAAALPPLPIVARSPQRWLAIAGLLAAALAIVFWRSPDALTRSIHIDPNRSEPSFDEPPGLSGLAARADVIVLGAASDVQRTSVEFTVQRVLRGDATLRALPLRRLTATNDVPWQVGADVLLFLQREPTSGDLLPVGGAAGALRIGATGIDGLTVDDITHALAHDGVAPARIVALLDRHGPAALQHVEHHCQQFAGWSMPTTTAGFQRGLLAWLQQIDPARVDRYELLTAMGWLAPASAAELDPTTRQHLTDVWPRVRDENNALFDAATFLGASVRAGDATARTRLLDVLARIDAASAAAGKLTMHVRYHADLLALQATFDAAAAARTATALLDRIDAKDQEAIDLLMVQLVKWEPAAGTARALARFQQRFADGERTGGLAPLLASAPADVVPVLRQAMQAERFGERFLRYDSVLLDVLAAARPNPVLHELRDALRPRVAATTAPFDAFENWLLLHRAAGGALADATALPHYLTTAFPGGFGGLQFVRMLEQWSARKVLPFVEPTAAELSAAARALAN